MDPLTQVFVEDMKEDMADDLLGVSSSYGELIDQLSSINDEDINTDKDEEELLSEADDDTDEYEDENFVEGYLGLEKDYYI